MPKRKPKSQDTAFATAGRGRYIKKDPPSPSVKGIVETGEKPAIIVYLGRRLRVSGRGRYVPILSHRASTVVLALIIACYVAAVSTKKCLYPTKIELYSYCCHTDYYGVQRLPPKPRSEQAPMSSSGSRNITNARSLSVPSLRTNVDLRVKESPPHSPAKPRSTSVRLNPRKTLSFKRFRKMFEFGSRSDLEDGSRLHNDEQTVGTYHKLSNRPRSIGSDCSNSSYTNTTDFIRNDSFRVSRHSRTSHGIMDTVFDRHRQLSYDSNDYINHVPSGSTDSNLRPYSVAISLPRSSSSSSLKNFGLQTRPNDYRHHSIAAMPAHSTEVPPNAGSFGDERAHRRQGVRIPLRTQEDAAESAWEDSQSFDYTQVPVLPSHPEYPQIAQDLMTASPPRRNSAEITPAPLDMCRMSDMSTTVDPRRVSNDSGVESSKPFRSQPSTPVVQTLTSVRTEGTSSPEVRTSPPHGELFHPLLWSACNYMYMYQSKGYVYTCSS